MLKMTYGSLALCLAVESQTKFIFMHRRRATKFNADKYDIPSGSCVSREAFLNRSNKPFLLAGLNFYYVFTAFFLLLFNRPFDMFI